jgi:hypothetical protein
MKTIILLFILICGNAFSQTIQRKNLIFTKWTLTSGQSTRENVFAADTLTFENLDKYSFHDSIRLKPFLEFTPREIYKLFIWVKPSFEFGFKSNFEYINGRPAIWGCQDIQLGYWSINKIKATITLTYLKGGSEDLSTLTVDQKIKYSIHRLTADELILVKK